MKKTIRLTESDLMRIVKRVINEQSYPSGIISQSGPKGYGGGLEDEKETKMIVRTEIMNELNRAMNDEETSYEELCANITKICNDLSKRL